MARRRIEDEIEALGRVRDGPRAEAAVVLRKALAGRVNLLAAKAARLAAEMELGELVPDLLGAFDRLFEDPTARDPQCWGKNAIAGALVALGLTESAPFLRGARHVQMEPVWGRLEDMAPVLRGICLLALAACADVSRDEVMRCLVEGLADPAHTVRVDAVRAIEQMAGEEAALLLYLKARTGDVERAVTGQVFDSLLRLEGTRAVPVVAAWLEAGPAETREEAALSLGASRLRGTVERLRAAWEASRDAEFRQVILRALATSREPEAMDFLRDLAAGGRQRDAEAAREALAMLSSPPAPPCR